LKFNKTARLQGNKLKMPEICGDTVGNRLRGPPCFLLAGNPVGNAPIMASTFKFGYLPKCIHYSVSIAEKVELSLDISHRPPNTSLGTAQMVSKSF
jgi:hypothetical protein